MTVPWLLKRVVDAIAAGAALAALAARRSASIVAIALVQGVVRTFSRFVIFNVGRDIEYDLRNDLFAHLERLPLGFYQQRQTGDLMSRLVNDITAVRMLLGPGILNFINTPVYYVYGLAIMLSIDARLTLASLAVYPVGAALREAHQPAAHGADAAGAGGARRALEPRAGEPLRHPRRQGLRLRGARDRDLRAR